MHDLTLFNTVVVCQTADAITCFNIVDNELIAELWVIVFRLWIWHVYHLVGENGIIFHMIKASQFLGGDIVFITYA